MEDPVREFASILGVSAAALLLIAAAVFAGGDRSLFVPVPEMVTEDFAREITTRRFDLAMKYLSQARRRAESPQTLEAMFDPLLTAVGTVNTVDSETRSVNEDHAIATATVEGDRGARSFDVSLVHERDGLWRIHDVRVVQ